MNITRESIFVGAVRSFFTSFAAVLGILIAVILIFVALFAASGPNLQPERTDIAIAPDAQGNMDLLPDSAPVILRINIHGVIGDRDLTSSKVEQLLLASHQGILKNQRVKAVLLHMNTPGGVTTDSDNIYRALMEYKKRYQVPIYTYVDGMCASGGMYIASASERIYANPSSVVGSIGVLLGPTFNFSQAMEKWGIQSLTLTEGIDKDMLNPFRPWKEGEDQSLRKIMAVLYERFVHIITTARPQIDKEKLINEYGAQVFISEEAKKIGLIDVYDSEYQDALTGLAQAAGIHEDEKYQVFQLEIPHPFLSALTGNVSLLTGKLTHIFQLGPHMSSELSGKFLYLYQPHQERF